MAAGIIGQNCYCVTICGHMSLPSLCVNKHLHHTVSCGGWQSGSQWLFFFSSLSQMILSGSIAIDLHANTFRIQQAWLSGCTYLSNVGFYHVTHVVREWCKASRRWRICECCRVCSLVKQRFQFETPENLRRKAERRQWRVSKKATAFLVSQLKSYCAPIRTESQIYFLSCFIHCKFSQHWCLTKNSCQFVSRGLTKFFLTCLNRVVFFIIQVNVSRSQGYRLPRCASGMAEPKGRGL